MSETTSPPPGRNRLALEKSPYLLQHADNPVDWYPWGAEAFAEAARRDKPVFLSIGYSTCHWCHVMEHESFEDSTVAAAMNDAFVCVKVDREERPDIDNVYMTVCQMMTGSGGWPLTILLTPDRRPFFAATYLPRESMLRLAAGVTEAWETKRDRVLDDATRLTEALREAAGQAATDISGGGPGEAQLHQAARELAARYDSTWGGFGAAPKFPTPHNLLFLLRYWKRTGDPRSLEMVERTLERMRRGGIFDQVGYGFHRYSTDPHWLLPHFEKMLYDQAMLVMAYTEAFLATDKAAYRETAEQVIAYVLRDLDDPAGGFHSAEDADSDGEEGKFYVWTAGELRDVLGDDADLAMTVFGAREEGNFSDEAGRGDGPVGANILHLEKPLSERAAALGMDESALATRVESMRGRLLEARATRVRPGLDDKVLADWNGLMIAALSRAARAFGRDDYAARARRAADFVLERMSDPDGGLLHRYRGGEASITGMVDDYAFMIQGLLDLYEATFDPALLERALGLAGVMIDRFWDDEHGGLFFTADDGEALIVRSRAVYDGAVPSGNSVAMLDLVRLARMTGRTEYEARAREIGAAFHDAVSRAPSAFTQLLCAVDFLAGPSYEVVLVGRPGDPGLAAMQRALAASYLPNTVVLVRPEGDGGVVADLAPYTREQTATNGAATAYVCRNFACELPTSDVDRMLSMVRGK